MIKTIEKDMFLFVLAYRLAIDTHIRSKRYKVVYFWVFLPKNSLKADDILLEGTPKGGTP